MKVCICGGGNLGHVAAGFIASRTGHDVCLLTSHPERWHQCLIVERPDGHALLGKLSGCYSDPQQAVANADVVLLCLPGYAIREVLSQIRGYLEPHAAVGSVVSSTGFFFQAMELLPEGTPLFGLQRVPFIARTGEYGRRARLMGYKDSLRLAVEHTSRREELRQTVERLFNTPTCLMDNFYEVSLSNSNPLLHPARLYDLWCDWQEGERAERVPLFYEEWTERAARLYIDMDEELQLLLKVLPVRQGCLPTVLEYYESANAVALAQKLRSIEAFKGIRAPMKAVDGGFVPDFQSRYFTEDFAYGLDLIRRLAATKGVATPVMDMVSQWAKAWLAPAEAR